MFKLKMPFRNRVMEIHNKKYTFWLHKIQHVYIYQNSLACYQFKTDFISNVVSKDDYMSLAVGRVEKWEYNLTNSSLWIWGVHKFLKKIFRPAEKEELIYHTLFAKSS